MARLSKEEIVTLKVLVQKGCSNVEIAQKLGITEGAVRYQRNKLHNPQPDRRQKTSKADAFEHIIHSWFNQHQDDDRPPNIKDLFENLRDNYQYEGSYRSVLRFARKHYPKPKRRTYRRIETPPGAQTQTDWASFPKARLADGSEGLSAFIMVLSHSRQVAIIWSHRQDQLSWLRCHNEAFQRLGGIAAVNRIDNLKTAISKGAGAWGEINTTYRTYARTVGFHIDACEPRKPNQKGKVEAKVRLSRLLIDPSSSVFGCAEELQNETDLKVERWSKKTICPITGEKVYDSWQQELGFLATLPVLPEPFDVVVTRKVSKDCLVNFEGRQYSVPFEYSGQHIEVRGCCGKVQLAAEGKIVREYPRHTVEKLVLDPSCYEGESTENVHSPAPMGKMGRRMQELMELPVEKRPLDLYAALSEVAR